MAARFVHPMALCDSEEVGEGTRIWAFAHVMKGARVGVDCNIGEGVFIESGAVLGNRVTLKNQVMIWDGVTIGDEAFIGPGVIFTNDAAPRSPRMPLVEQRYHDPARWRVLTTVEPGASLGAGAIILPGVTIGAFALVGAGSVVTRSVAPHRVVVGNPARPIGWVCACGTRLDANLHCGTCNVSHQLDSNEQLQRV
jgi:UDP-2-acetamido-3-amino-2,3-dideoxy-glucuronate N-acetyltransferase